MIVILINAIEWPINYEYNFRFPVKEQKPFLKIRK